MSEPSHPAPFTLERFVAGDLAARDREGVTGHLGSCERCRRRVDELRADIESFGREVPFEAFAARQAARFEGASRPRRLRFALPVGLGLAAAAAAVLFLAVPRTDDGVTRVKGGGPTLAFTVREGDDLHPGVSGETVAEGAHLQLRYEAGRWTYVALVGLDGAGRAEVYYPADGDALAPLPAGTEGPFPFSLTLDDTPGVERFIAVFGDAPLPLAEVRAALQRAPADPARFGELVLPRGMVASSVWIRHAEP